MFEGTKNIMDKLKSVPHVINPWEESAIEKSLMLYERSHNIKDLNKIDVDELRNKKDEVIKNVSSLTFLTISRIKESKILNDIELDIVFVACIIYEDILKMVKVYF